MLCANSWEDCPFLNAVGGGVDGKRSRWEKGGLGQKEEEESGWYAK